jgi:hypothetical protein
MDASMTQDRPPPPSQSHSYKIRRNQPVSGLPRSKAENWQRLKTAILAILHVEAVAFDSTESTGEMNADLEGTILAPNCDAMHMLATLQLSLPRLLPHVQVGELVPAAQEPILRLCLGGIDISLTVIVTASALPMFRKKLLNQYFSLEPRLVHLMHAIKAWAQIIGLVGEQAEYLSPYALTLMAIYFAQIRGAVPVMQGEHLTPVDIQGCNVAFGIPSGWRKAEPAPDLSLAAFLRFYATEYAWGYDCVSVSTGRRCDIPKEARPKAALRSINIADVFDGHDVAELSPARSAAVCTTFQDQYLKTCDHALYSLFAGEPTYYELPSDGADSFDVEGIQNSDVLSDRVSVNDGQHVAAGTDDEVQRGFYLDPEAWWCENPAAMVEACQRAKQRGRHSQAPPHDLARLHRRVLGIPEPPKGQENRAKDGKKSKKEKLSSLPVLKPKAKIGDEFAGKLEDSRTSSQNTDDATIVMEGPHGSCPPACASSRSSTPPPRKEDANDCNPEEAEDLNPKRDRLLQRQEWWRRRSKMSMHHLLQ